MPKIIDASGQPLPALLIHRTLKSVAESNGQTKKTGVNMYRRGEVVAVKTKIGKQTEEKVV